MKYIFLIFMLVQVSESMAQEPYTLYYNKDGRKTSKDSAYYYEKGAKLDKMYHGEIKQFYVKNDVVKSTSFYDKKGMQGTRKRYYESGVLKLEDNHVNGRRRGEYHIWYKSGTQKEDRNYLKLPEDFDSGTQFPYLLINHWDSTGTQQVTDGEGYLSIDKQEEPREQFDILLEEYYSHIEGQIKKGKREGVWQGFDLYGHPFEEYYKKGELVSGKLTKADKTEVTYRTTTEQAEPKTGFRSFYQYVGKNMKYPTDARLRGKEGRVFVQFVVDKEGVLTQVKTIKGFYPSCNEEAEKVIRKAKKWKPARLRGVPVKVRMILPITFSLN